MAGLKALNASMTALPSLEPAGVASTLPTGSGRRDTLTSPYLIDGIGFCFDVAPEVSTAKLG